MRWRYGCVTDAFWAGHSAPVNGLGVEIMGAVTYTNRCRLVVKNGK